MPAAADTDHAVARTCMIEGQIRPERVRHPFLLAAMGALPRERFVPEAVRALAYVDKELPIGGGRMLTEPRVLARLLQAAEPRRGERALVVEAGSGYAAAVLATLGLAVTAVEPDETLRALGEAACAEAGATVSWRDTLPGKGGPFDLVLIDGGVEFVPDAVASLVALAGGRLATVLREPGRPGRAVIGERLPGDFRLRPLFDAQSSLLPAYRREPGFVF